MLKVLPVQSKDTQKEICEKCGVKYNPDLMAYSSTVDDKLTGICQFKLTDKGGFLYDLAAAEGTNDFESLFVMGRGTLNFIDLCGVHRAFFVGECENDALLRAVGFKKNNEGVWEINLEGFFTDHCHEHK